jgi:hypothetical protein
MHGSNPRQWVRALRQCVGEPADYSLATES